ncbi:MAG: hypothetical protein HUJ99_08540 [Bacteroidaceae bacterium]|nr:hypothetical protein [Bacteroidaceae bacterium]
MKDELLKTLALAAAATPQMAWAQSHDPARPNILCVVCEDISSYLGCYGTRAKVGIIIPSRFRSLRVKPWWLWPAVPALQTVRR